MSEFYNTTVGDWPSGYLLQNSKPVRKNQNLISPNFPSADNLFPIGDSTIGILDLGINIGNIYPVNISEIIGVYSLPLGFGNSYPVNISEIIGVYSPPLVFGNSYPASNIEIGTL